MLGCILENKLEYYSYVMCCFLKRNTTSATVSWVCTGNVFHPCFFFYYLTKPSISGNSSMFLGLFFFFFSCSFFVVKKQTLVHQRKRRKLAWFVTLFVINWWCFFWHVYWNFFYSSKSSITWSCFLSITENGRSRGVPLLIPVGVFITSYLLRLDEVMILLYFNQVNLSPEKRA